MNIIGFDDGPFAKSHRGDVPLVGVLCAGTRVDGVLVGRVRRDGANAARAMAAMVKGSRLGAQLHAILLQGVAVAGFNVVDAHALHAELGAPVLVVVRRAPDLAEIRRTLLRNVPGGARKWRLIEKLGMPEPLEGVYVQRVGLSLDYARRLLVSSRLHGSLPEPLRVAHLFAGALVTGKSRGRA